MSEEESRVFPDLQKAYDALKGKQSPYGEYWDYYDGNQPLIYSAARLRELFRTLNTRFVENWCAVVVDSALDRIQLQGFRVSQSDELTDRLNATFQETELNLDADDAHLATLVAGESFLIAWKEAPGDPIEAYYNDPRMCHVQYDPASPRKKLWAAKWWVGDDGKTHLTLYYPDKVLYFVADKAGGDLTSAKEFQPDETPEAANPFGIVPVFHLRRERRTIKSELANAKTPQDAINKLLADMMVTAEFSAFPQRYVISTAENLGKLKNAPNEVWDLPAGADGSQATQAGQFAQADLEGYFNAMDKLAAAIAIITRTPKHYFFAQGGDPSGEALIALEAPLNKKCQRYINRFIPVWRKLGAFLLKLDGREVDENAVEPLFERPETVQPQTRATVRKTSVDAGLPLVTVLRREENWSEADLNQLDEDAKKEKARATASLAQALLAQQRNFDQGSSNQDEEQPDAIGGNEDAVS